MTVQLNCAFVIRICRTKVFLTACDIYKKWISVSSLIRNVVDAREIEITTILTTSTGGSPRRPLHDFVNDLYSKCVKSVIFILTGGISERLTKFGTVSRRDLYY